MKITYNWLKDYVDLSWAWPELVERLTLAGLAIEAVEDLGRRYEGVFVGRVRERRAHPDADRLSVCQVEIGEQVHTIVCGAPNVAAGQKVPVILPGYNLPDGTPIRQARIRGVASHGMICSEVELGLGADASGIMVLGEEVQAGIPFARAAGLDDVVLDFEVTPNRPDCLSLLGIAREVRALTGQALRLPAADLEETGAPADRDVRIDIEDAGACPRYLGRIVRNVRIGPSPPWLQRRLQAVGQRPINNVVDATNYALLELGHPLHAFDLEKLRDRRIAVRRARSGEALQTLDGEVRTLDPEMLVIADGRGPVALAGIMGGANSEVGETTTDLLLESAYFAPGRVRRARALLGMHTEAAMRFERGADWEMAPFALDRAAHLIAQVAGGQVAPGALDIYPAPRQRRRLQARIARLNQLLATDLDGPYCARVLELLGCQVESREGVLEVTAPSFRPDLEREADLVEEVGRIYGYDRIPGSRTARGPWIAAAESRLSLRPTIRSRLAGLGFDEVTSNTIVESRWLQVAGQDAGAVLLANPPTESQNALRTTLVPSLLDVARRNFNQRAPSVAVFELGKCFPQRGEERLRLAALWAGLDSASTWQQDRREVDFFALKGVLEALLANPALACTPQEHPACRPGYCARLQLGGEFLGWLGEVRPSLRSAFDIERPVYIFELEFDVVAGQWHSGKGVFAPLPKFPPLERDLAVVLPREVSHAQVAEQIRAAAPGLIEAVDFFDLYQGEQIAAGSKSLAFSIRLRSPDRTLEDGEADAVIGEILARLKKSFGAELR